MRCLYCFFVQSVSLFLVSTLTRGLKEITALQEELARIPAFNREPNASWWG
jgi:hypothetical protein